jgi:hypothetical protein
MVYCLFLLTLTRTLLLHAFLKHPQAHLFFLYVSLLQVLGKGYSTVLEGSVRLGGSLLFIEIESDDFIVGEEAREGSGESEHIIDNIQN